MMISETEQVLIQKRMVEVNLRNIRGYMRKIALSEYVLHIDLSSIHELVSLQQRCSNNQSAIYPKELAALQQNYAALCAWGSSDFYIEIS